ncbi:M6 family metalloprotease domain-containing protein [Clostridium tunisiense]|uniref:M6 family metalloprotease domain-containing protein n=1 Tax=Clostridium tunisiense TaxID=219748 RepID=UPI0002D33F83|nr:M6 family metalloprotease domain-containing protein [Clostridium tunisiense]
MGKVTKIWTIIFTIMLLAISKDVQAVPANNKSRVVAQPNGVEFKATLSGDEKLNYLVGEEGSILTKGNDDYWHYSNMKYGQLIPLEEKYNIDGVPEQRVTKDNLGQKLQIQRPLLAKKARISAYNSNRTPAPIQKALVLLVQFNDVKLSYSSESWYDSIFNLNSKSLSKYYKDNSFNKINFQPVQESEGTSNDGVINVTLNYNHPNYGGKLEGIQYNIRDVLVQANTYINFKDYDKDGDGKLTAEELHLVIVVAGQEASTLYEEPYVYEPSIWAHKSSVPLQFSLDGINFFNQDYIAIGEKHQDHKATIGALTHEIGHNLGLPDLYDTDYSSQGVGEHSLMGSGSWGNLIGEYSGQTPANLDPWSKIYLGLLQPKVINYETEEVLNSYSLSGQYNVVKVPTRNPKEYFLLENRQHTSYDESLRTFGINSGVAIWHINEAVIEANMGSNTVNDNEYSKGVDLEEANEAALGIKQLDLKEEDYALSGYRNGLKHYFNKSLYSTFSTNTIPNSNLQSNSSTGLTFNVLSDSSASMNIKISGKYFVDFDNDGYIDIKDLGTVAKAYNVSNSQSAYERRLDVNGDSIIDLYDLVKVSLGFGQ